MHAVQTFKPLGLLSAVILTCGLSFLALRWPQGRHATFSRHAAARRVTILYYVVLFALALPPLLLFFACWFVPTFRLSDWFIAFAAASELLQHSVTLIPETGDRRTRWHRRLTDASAAFLPLMLVLVLTASAVPRSGKVTAGIGLLFMLGIAAYHGLFSDKAEPRNGLILQAGYYGTFFAVILSLTY